VATGQFPHTPDGRYFVVRGRLWRASDPHLPAAERARLVAELMRARSALRRKNAEPQARASARRQVHAAKVALGERGSVWWTDGAPDFNRHLVKNTPYRAWFEALTKMANPKNLSAV